MCFSFGVIVGGGGICGFIFQEPVGKFAFNGIGFSSGHGPISFLDVAFAEHFAHAFEGFGCAGEDDESADGAIEAVHGV